jgi:hypothetical protein
MRKGLVVTLGVVALVIAVSPGFALAPVITCVPDIIVSDVENNTMTDDLNFFIFSDVLDFDDYVRDVDNATTEIRWCFIETSPGNSLRINTRVSNPAVNPVEPGPDDLRAIDQMMTVENILWSGTPITDPSMQSMIELIASDGTTTDSTNVTVTTVNDSTAPFNNGQGDGVAVPAGVSYTFDAQQDWEWYTFSGITGPSAHSVSGGSLVITEDAAQVPLVFGTWESTKNPNLAAKSKAGCVMRSRFTLRSSATGEACPGFRLRANWFKVVWNATYAIWVLDYGDQDFNAEQQLAFSTFRGIHIDGREPGTTPKVYTLLYYPEQTDTLETTGVTYIAFDLLDNDTFPGANDAGTLYCDQVDIDWFDNPNIGKGRAESGLSTSDFSSWTPGITKIADGWNSTGLVVNRDANRITITVTAANKLFEASCVGPGVVLEPDRYYRASFMVTSSQVPGGPFGPTVRGAINSTRWILGNVRDLKGGGVLSALTSTARPYQVWLSAPSADTGSSVTEPMQLVFESWLTSNPDAFFPTKTVQGTVTCEEVITESWAPF